MTDMPLHPASPQHEMIGKPFSNNTLRRMLASLLASTAKRLRALANWSQRLRQRRHLAALEDHLLRDIGISRRQARHEASRWG